MSTDVKNPHVEEQFDNIKHADNDHKKYRGLVLENKMKILLISDSKTDISIAAMDVNIGYNQDPDDLPGLAHLCEHMLPMGTKKYPAQDEYDMYVSQSNGHQNATTSLNSTNYYFTAIPEKLKGGLDRFVEFFIEPRFNEDLIEKEINNIHSEYNKLLTKEEYRLIALEKLSIKPDHPYSKFNIGNKETLDEIPKKLKINVGTKLRKFYEKYYSANIMSLCILSKDSIDVLENMVVDRFRNVENKNVELPTYSEHPFKDKDFNTKWYCVPILNIRMLSISFSLSEKQRDHRMPLDYIEHLLRHESKGSLLSALKARGWCDKLEATDDHVDTSIHFFNVTFHLTEEGINHVDDIVQIMFQYINMLKKAGPMKWIYDEIENMSDINNCYNENIHRLSHEDISRIARRLHECPMEEIFSEQREWRSDLIEELMKECFTPQNIRIYVASKTYESTENETEKWYNIKYKKEKIPEKTMKMWNHAGCSPDLKFPPKNEFIPTEFDIKPKPNVPRFIPIIVMDTPFVRVWHKKDDKFYVPKATMIFHFVSPFAYMDPLSSELTDVFVELVRESLNEYTYRAKLAGLKLEITSTIYGIQLVIDGYNEMQRLLVIKSMSKIINFKIGLKTFRDLNWTSKYMDEDIYQNTKNYLEMLLTEQHWLEDESLESTAHLSVHDKLKLFIPKLFSKMHVECLIYGNVTEMEATDIGEQIESMLQTKKPPIVPLLQKQLVLYRGIKLENGCHVRFEEKNKVEVTSSTIVYYATGLRSTESNMLLSLSNRIIHQKCSNILRTTYTLGYTVFSKICMMNGTQYLTVAVQGNRRPPYVEDRIDLFVEDMFEHISTMPKEEFDNHKKSLVSLYLKEPDTISSQGFLYWKEIESQEYNFNRKDIEVPYLRTITQQQLRQFLQENIHSKLTQRKLSVHVMPTAMAVEMNLSNTSGKITVFTSDNKTKIFDNLLSFKLSQSLYPLLEPIDENVVRKGIKCF